MRINSIHSVLLSFLIILGLGFAQTHQLSHAAEWFQTEAGNGDQQNSSNHESEDCLTCTLSVTALHSVTYSVSLHFSSKEIKYFSNHFHIEQSATRHIRPRAPPVLYITS
ncbi:hypothetical protein BH23BAC3_BH23BAC3_29410 [soil metagenome]